MAQQQQQQQPQQQQPGPPVARVCPVTPGCPGPPQPATAEAWFQHIEQEHHHHRQQPGGSGGGGGITCRLCAPTMVHHQFTTQAELVQHQRAAHADNADLFRGEWYCQQCDKQEDTLDDWTAHKNVHHVPLHAMGQADPAQAQAPPPPRVGGAYQTLAIQGPVAHQHLTQVYGMDNHIMILELSEPPPPPDRPPVPSDLFRVMNERRADVRRLVSLFLGRHRRMKISVGLRTVFSRLRADGTETIEDYTRTATRQIDNVEHGLRQVYDNGIMELWKYVENFIRMGSNWTVAAYSSLLVHCYALPPLSVGHYQPTPRELGRKRCIINVRSADNFCLKWALVASVVHAKATEQEQHDWLRRREQSTDVTTYTRELAHHWSDHLDLSELTPGELITGHTVERFEATNPTYAVNLFHYMNRDADLTARRRRVGLDREERVERKLGITQFHTSSVVHERTTVLNLLILEQPATGEHHVVSITHLDRLLNKSGQRGGVVCPKCLQWFRGATLERSRAAFAKHRDAFCARREFDKYNVNFPDTHLSFTRADYSMQLPFLLFGDFETWGEPGGQRLNRHTPQRRIINRHHLMGYSIGVVTTPGISEHLQSRFTQRSYSGPHAERYFIADLCSLKALIHHAMAEMEQQHGTLKPRAEFTPQEEALAEAEHCHICQLPITHHGHGWKAQQEKWVKLFRDGGHDDDGGGLIDQDSLPEGYWRGPRVVDHCHYTGRIRGAAHSVCNLQYQWRLKKIPFYFHNGTRFDNSLLVPMFQKYPEYFKPGKIIASTCERFKSVSDGGDGGGGSAGGGGGVGGWTSLSSSDSRLTLGLFFL